MYLHHLKGLDKFYLDHKKISGLLSISYKNLRAQFYLKILWKILYNQISIYRLLVTVAIFLHKIVWNLAHKTLHLFDCIDLNGKWLHLFCLMIMAT